MGASAFGKTARELCGVLSASSSGVISNFRTFHFGNSPFSMAENRSSGVDSPGTVEILLGFRTGPSGLRPCAVLKWNFHPVTLTGHRSRTNRCASRNR